MSSSPSAVLVVEDDTYWELPSNKKRVYIPPAVIDILAQLAQALPDEEDVFFTQTSVEFEATCRAILEVLVGVIRYEYLQEDSDHLLVAFLLHQSWNSSYQRFQSPEEY